MDKASDYESGDSRFESWQGRSFTFLLFTIISCILAYTSHRGHICNGSKSKKARKRESGIKRDREANLRIVLDEEEEHHILAKVLDGQVERVLCAGLEHVVQQWGTQVCKVPRVQIVLWGEHGSNTTKFPHSKALWPNG